MHIASHTRTFWSLDALSREDWQRVRDQAGWLRQAADEGRPQRPLRGKNVAVLCETTACPELEAFRQAAASLGAQVTQVRPSEARINEYSSVDAVGSLLGRLYDAIDCHDLPTPLVEQLAQAAGKPVIHDLACGAALPAQAFGPDASPAPDDEHYVLQALLLMALA